MRHRVYGKHFGRNKDERQALFKGLVRSLLTYGTIQTSEIKAKAIKGLVDKIITSAKADLRPDSLVQSYIIDKGLRERLIKDIIPKLGSRTSGYTRTVRMGTQLGDQTTIVKMSLIGSEELKPIARPSLKEKKEAKKIEAKESGVAKKETVKKTTANKKVVTK